MRRSTFLGRGLRYLYDSVKFAIGDDLRSGNAGSLRVQSMMASTARTVMSSAPQGDVDHVAQMAITNPYVLSAADLIGMRVQSHIDAFKVQEEKSGGKWVDVESHELIAVLRDPNSLMAGTHLLNEVAYWEILYGNCYWLLNTRSPGVGPIEEIWPMPAGITDPLPDKGLRISSITGRMVLDYEYRPGTTWTIPGENVVHLRRANPFDYFRGLAVTTALQFNLEVTYSQNQYAASFYGPGNAVPTAVISVPPELDDLEIEQIRQDIISQFGSSKKTAVTRAGDMDVKIISHTMQDMQVLDAHDHYAREVRQLLHVPEGLNSASSGESRLAAQMALQEDVIQPLLNHIAEGLGTKALPMYRSPSGRRYRLIAENIVSKNKALEATLYQVYGKDRTTNENRADQDLPPLTFNGVLAPLQPLLDQVPSGMLQLIAPFLTQNASGPQQNGTPQHPLIGAMTGQTLVDQLTGQSQPKQGGDVLGQLTGGAPSGLLEAKRSDSGNPLQDQLMADLTGIKTTLTPAELATIQHLLLGVPV